jgi:phospholipid/cholesterol/gamma-HCH transport system substrate-binding protein
MNEFKVGLMALASMAAVVVMSLMITSNQSGFGDYVTYRTIINDASGIFPKTPIKVAGINAGRIKNIELQGNKALITFEVLKRVKITENSQLKIKAVGFLGDKYLEIYVGNSPNRLGSNAFLESLEGGGVEALVKDASEVMKDVKVIVKSIKDSVAPPGEKPPIKAILEDVKELVHNTKTVTASLKRVVTGNEQKFNNIVDNLEGFSEQLAYHLDKDEPESAISDVKEILSKTDTMMGDLKGIVRDVRDGKGTVGKLLVEEEIADEVKQTLAGVKKIVTKVDNIRTEVEVFVGANTTSGEGESVAELKIFPSPERFYILGVAASELGPKTTTQTTTTQNGVSSTIEEVERKKDTYRFTAQIGRRVQNWSFRGGFIDSSGGLGVDYDFFATGTKLTFEAFDYRDDLGANLRIGIDQRLWSAIYLRAQAEDLSNDINYIFSAGLKFNDEDLKGLLGFFL